MTKSKKSKKRPAKKLTLKEWFDTKFVPAISKIGNQRHLAAIRDSFGTMIPIIIAGSLGVLINAIIFGGAGSGYVSLLGLIAKAAHPEFEWQEIGNIINGQGANAALMPGWAQTRQIGGLAFGHINTVTVGMMSIWFSFLFGYYIAISRNFRSPIIAGLVSSAAFLLASLGEVAFFMDAKGLISAIIFGIIATELFIWLSTIRALDIKLPDGVPPAVGKSFRVFLPAFFTLTIIGAVNIAVLAPAIITGDLSVTESKSLVFTDTSADAGLHWTALFNNANVTAKINALGDDARFADYKDLITTLANNFQAGDQAAWNTWYEGLEGTDKSVVSTAVAYLGGVSLDSFRYGIDQTAPIHLIDNGSGSFIVTVQWIQIALGPDKFGMSAAIYQFITSWFISFATGSGGLGIAILYVFLVSLFWFFGIHGSNVVGGIFEPIFLMILGVNNALVTSMGYDAAAATGQMGVFARSFFDAYMYVGGSGGTLGLLIAILFFSKRRELKEISKFALPAGVFQINEPVIFGVPIVLNPVYVTPFVITPILSLLIGWVFSPAVLGFVKYSYIAVPWTAPWFLGAMLTSLDVKALLPALIVGVLTVVMYTPFVLIDNSAFFKKLRKKDYPFYMETMRYFNDPKYKYITDTTTKYNSILSRADIAEGNAAEEIDFWTKKYQDKDKTKLKEKIKHVELKRDEKINKLTLKANTYKEKREEVMPKHEERWEQIKEVRTAKFNAHEAKLKAKEKAHK